MIHIVNMPFGSLTHPAIAPALIKAQLNGVGIECRVFNFNFDFARLIGFGEYETLAFFKRTEVQVGEWLFAKEAWRKPFGLPEDDFIKLCDTELTNILRVQDKKTWLKKIRNEIIPIFLQSCLETLERAGEIKVVGFSCSFFQTISSLALGRLIKEKYPHAKIVYGGSCFHGEMGDELIRKVPWIDAVSVGEADDIMVSYFKTLLEGRIPSGFQGILYRDTEGKVQCGPPNCPASKEVFEALPHPDFGDFFKDAAKFGLLKDQAYLKRIILPFEGSRGCWWGEKHHCKFCGLNGVGLNYRTKSPEKVYDNLREYEKRGYPAVCYQAGDNNLSLDSFNNLLPWLKENPLKNNVVIFYCVKPNMKREQIKLMAEAGIRYTQPGIESLSSHLLKLMNKGVSTLQNVFFMKCCREYGIVVYWNNLIRIPGEKPEDYASMKELIPKIHHIRPPTGGAPQIECHRFSPYFAETGKYIENVRPQPWYNGLFPSDDIDISRVAYYFDAKWKDTLSSEAYDEAIDATLEWIRIWIEQPELPQLVVSYNEDSSANIIDTRDGSKHTFELNANEAKVYKAINDPASLNSIATSLKERFDTVLPDKHIQGILDGFTKWNLAIEENGIYLGLALPEGIEDPPHNVRKIQLRLIKK